MAEEVFKVKNPSTTKDVLLSNWGWLVGAEKTIELGDYDKAIGYIADGTLVRIIEALEVPVNRANQMAYKDNRTITGEYVGTGVAFDIVTGFSPRKMEIVDEETGEVVFKNKRHAAWKCLLRKNYGTDQVMKVYKLTADGVQFDTDRAIIGSSNYVNESGKTYTYVILG